MDVDDDELRDAMGIEAVYVDPDEVVEAWREVGDAAVADLRAEVSAGWTIEGDVDEGESLERTPPGRARARGGRRPARPGRGRVQLPRAAVPLRRRDRIAPCWALGRLTTAGRPFTCTGDILTAVAMLTTKRLGAAALYHEIEAIDYATGEVVIANSGEHDLAWLGPGRAAATPEERLVLRQGPALRGLRGPRTAGRAGDARRLHAPPRRARRVPLRHRARRADARRFPETGTANGAFRFADGTVEEAWARWAASGVNHHSSATPGDLSADVAGSPLSWASRP